MSDDDLTIRVDLDITPAEKKLSELDSDINSTLSKTISRDSEDFSMSDAAFERTVSGRGTQEIGKDLNSSIEKFSSFITSIPDRFSRSVQGAVDNWKDIFSKLNIGKKDFGEPDYEFIKMEQDSERAVDIAPVTPVKRKRGRPRKIKTEDVDLSEFGADDLSRIWSQEGSDAYSRFKLQQMKRKAQIDMKEFDEMHNEEGARSAAERFAMADGALRASRLKKKVDSQGIKQDEVTDETKQQNREYTEQIFKLGKIFALLSAIKGVATGIKNAGTTVLKIIQEQAINTKREYGSITVDPKGAGQASTDKTRAIWLEGLRNLGVQAPFTEDVYDKALERMTDIHQNAMTGNVNADDAIAFQWAENKYGTGFGATKLLAGDPSRTKAEVFKDVVNKLEDVISSERFWNQSEIGRAQDLQYFSMLFGKEVIDGIMDNVSRNRQSGTSVKLSERVATHGASAYTDNDISILTRQLGDDFAELRKSLSDLKKVITEITGKPVQGVVKVAKKAVDWLVGGLSLLKPENIRSAIENQKRNSSAAKSLLKKDIKLSDPISNAASKDVWDKHMGEDRKEAANQSGLVDKNIEKFNKIFNEGGTASEWLNAAIVKNRDSLKTGNFAWDYVKSPRLSSYVAGLMSSNFGVDDNGNVREYENDTMEALAKAFRKKMDIETLKGMTFDELWYLLFNDADLLSVVIDSFGQGGRDDFEGNPFLIAKYMKDTFGAKTIDYLEKAIAAGQFEKQGIVGSERGMVNGEVILYIKTDNANGLKIPIRMDTDTKQEVTIDELSS